MTNLDLSILFFLQMAAVLTVCMASSAFFKWLGQPKVVSEMIAGVVMGPSVFGLLFPHAQQAFFPKQSMTIMYAVCQIGLVLYMFLVGTEFQSSLIRQRLRVAMSVSIAGILLPFALGAVVAATLLSGDQRFFSESVGKYEAMLFLGASMSITAFPMLARLIYERGLVGTPLGTLALAAGSIDDAAAWCVLAVVLASFAGDATIAVLAIGGGGAFALLTLVFLRPWLRPLGRIVESRGFVSSRMLTFILVLVMLGAWFTDYVRIYAVFGAFVMGLAMPRGRLTYELQKKLEPLTTNFLVPLFFVYSGLNTRLGLAVGSTALWGFTLLLLACAILGKFGGCWAAARLNGENPREAVAIGTLMNARGMMELIMLNIGLERGIITPTLFTMLVIMAIVTTLMASPLFEVVYGRFHRTVQESSGARAAVAELPASTG